MQDPQPGSGPQGPALALAVALPTALAYSLPPSPTLLNQLLSLAAWGLAALWLGLRQPLARGQAATAAAPLLLALAGVAIGVLWAWGAGPLPTPIALGNLGVVGAAMLVAWLGLQAARSGDAAALGAWCLVGLLLGGVFNALVSLAQVFWPALTDGTWLAASGLPRRAVGNLRQPNHLASLLVWALAALAALLAMRRLRGLTAALLLPLLVGAVVLSGSRTGALDMLLLAAWGLADRRLPRACRVLLLAMPVAYALGWAGYQAWNATFEPLPPARGDISSSRFGIWANTLAMIAAQPWAGVGFGEFNFAWTLTPFPGRPVAFFDHVHNLPLQLVVELGLPLGGTVCALLAWALWQAARRAWARADDAALPARGLLMVLLLVGVHSQLEYPLWYAYFLLPTAFAWGFALGPGSAPPQAAARPGPVVLAGGAALVLAACVAVVDYMRVVVIYAPPANALPLAERMARGQRSWLYAHHADYAVLTTGEAEPAAQTLALQRAPHHLLDTRLMVAWAQALAERGETSRASHLAARLREFRNPAALDFFADCGVPTAAVRQFQCRPASAAHGWREFAVVPPPR